MKEAVFKYKCRMCGKEFDGVCCGEKFAPMVLQEILLNVDLGTKGFKGHLIESHICKMGNHGVGDLIGYIIRGT